MRALLLNLPWREEQRLGVRAGSRWPFTSLPEKDGRIHYVPFPFFLAYAAAVLKREGKSVKLFDAIAEGVSEENFFKKIYCFNPEFILVETSCPSFKNDLRIIHKIRDILPDCQIALSGPQASVFPEKILREYSIIKYILLGEYEYILLNLINCLEKKINLKSVSGLAYREDGEIKINFSQPAIDNLDSLPWPEREDMNIYKYNDGFAGLPVPNVQICASRGCPFQCNFCLWPQTIYKERKYRKRNPVDVVDEMEYLLNNFKFKAVYFDDDVFNINKDYVLNICNEIVKRKIKIPWAIMARVDLMDKSLLKVMSGAGLYAVKYGIESGDQNILNSCGKDMDLDKAYQAIRLTKQFGIKVHLTFCLGLPGETKQTIRRTVKFIRDVQPDSSQFSLATPFPGTEYFEYLKNRGELISEDWQSYDGNYKCVVQTPDLSSGELERIRIVLDNNFNA
ncbi:MAG: radical SAM protein [Candidatus Omnitrophota bacterium]